MSDKCCADACGTGEALNDKRWRRILWIALIFNVAMFFIEMGAGVQADSRALQADALDFFGDAAIWAFFNGTSPVAETMGLVGVLALIVNVGVALMLFRYRTGDANMRSVWICSRNDAISNVAVLAAALGVARTGSAWPDLGVAGIMAGLAITGGLQIVWKARGELKSVKNRKIAVGEVW